MPTINNSFIHPGRRKYITKYVLVGFLTILLSACVLNTPLEEPTKTIEGTERPATETQTVDISQTMHTPTQTVAPPLQTTGPFFMELNYSEGYYFVLTDASRTGKKKISLPDEIQKEITEGGGFIVQVELSEDGKWASFVGGESYYLMDMQDGGIYPLSSYSNLMNSLLRFNDVESGLSFSPDSKWLTFLEGEDGNSCNNPDPFPCRLFLNVMRLSDRQILWRVNILPQDYPGNFDRLLDSLENLPEDERDSLYSQIIFLFHFGIGSLSWSPNNQYLAFAGAVDGPSTDIYVYEPATNKLQRLTDGAGMVTSLAWTSDSGYVLHHASLSDGCAPGCGAEYIVALDGKPAREIPVDGCGYYATSLGWLTPAQILCMDGEWGNTIIVNDLLSDRVTTVLPDIPTAMAMDPDSKLILMAFDKRSESADLAAGYYFLNPETGSINPVSLESRCASPGENEWTQIQYLAIRGYRFLVGCETGSALVALNGETEEISGWLLIPSPDQKWLLNINGENNTMEILSAEFAVLHTLKADFLDENPYGSDLVYQSIEPYSAMNRYQYLIRWCADGEGFFYHSSLGLKYVNARTGESELVDENIEILPGWVAVN